MDVHPPSDWAEQGSNWDSKKSSSTATEPRPSGGIPPDFGLFGTPPEEWKDDTASGKSTQNSPDSTLDLAGSNAKSQANTGDSQESEEPSDFAPNKETYKGYEFKRKPHLERIPWPALPQPCPSVIPHMLWNPTHATPKPPSMWADVLQWTCCWAEELYVAKGSEPSWTKEVRAWVKTLTERCRKPFSHPLMGQAVPLMFIIRFLKAFFKIPKMCYEEYKSFIAPLIPWEYSRDASLPTPEDPDASKIDEYDRA